MIMFTFFNNATATTEIYTLSLHDALPIYHRAGEETDQIRLAERLGSLRGEQGTDRKSTRLNSSHQIISYAAFSLKKKTHGVLVVWLLTAPARPAMKVLLLRPEKRAPVGVV